MASATVVCLGGQLALCSVASSAAGPTRVGAQAGGFPSRARLLLGGSALPQLRCQGFGGFPQGSARQLSVCAKASETQVDAPEAATDFFKSAQAYWEKLDDKLAVGGLGVAALIVLWASTGLIGAIDSLPLLPGFFEFVGLVVTGWFTYRYLLFKPDREELLKIVDEAKGKITGEE